MNAQAIQHEILKTLNDAGGHKLLEDVLCAQVRSRLRPMPSKAELDDAITNLKQMGMILADENELEPENPYWLMDERGEAYALKHRL